MLVVVNNPSLAQLSSRHGPGARHVIEEASREDSGPSHSHFPQSGVFPAAALAAVEQQHALSEFLMGTRSGSIIKPSLLRHKLVCGLLCSNR